MSIVFDTSKLVVGVRIVNSSVINVLIQTCLTYTWYCRKKLIMKPVLRVSREALSPGDVRKGNFYEQIRTEPIEVLMMQNI